MEAFFDPDTNDHRNWNYEAEEEDNCHGGNEDGENDA